MNDSFESARLEAAWRAAGSAALVGASGIVYTLLFALAYTVGSEATRGDPIGVAVAVLIYAMGFAALWQLVKPLRS